MTGENFIECPNCHKEMRPLTYFTGELYCSKCHAELIDAIQIKDNAKCEDFALSQRCFADYLLNIVPKMDKGTIKHTKESHRKEATRAVRRAYEYCRSSAYAGNPYAILNMGYYLSHGYGILIENDVHTAKLFYEKALQSSDDEVRSIAKTALEDLNGLQKMQSGNSEFDRLIKIFDSAENASLSRTPLLGIVSVTYSQLQENERAKLLERLNKILRKWGKETLFFWNAERKRFEICTDEITDDLFDETGKNYLAFRNLKCKPSKEAVRAVQKNVTDLSGEKICENFFDILMQANLSQELDRTITLCDCDFVITKDEKGTERGKLDDLSDAIIDFWKEKANA